MNANDIQKCREDAKTLRRIEMEIRLMKEKHPEYLSLQWFDTTTLRLVSQGLDDDADQEERMNKEAA